MKKITINTIVLSLSIILGCSILGYFYHDIESKKIELVEDSTEDNVIFDEKNTSGSESEVKAQEDKSVEINKTTIVQTKQKECDQVYAYLKSKYTNIISVTYSAQLNDCMISLPDENGRPIYVKLSESTFD